MGKNQPTKIVAKERLRAVLETDRGHLSGKTLALFKRDLAVVMLSYMEIEESAMEVTFNRAEGGRSFMTLNLPVGKLRKMPIIAGEDEEIHSDGK